MSEFLQNLLKQAREFLAKLDKKERRRLILLAVLIIVFAIALTVLLTRVNYETLYSGLSTEDAGAVITALDEMGVRNYKTQGSGTILVPSGEASSLRMRLSAEGHVGGALDTSIFAQGSGFGTTDLEKQTYLQYQLQQNIRTAIMRMEKVQDCIVLINLPKESSFAISANNVPASASVLLELKSNEMLSKSESMTIAEFVTEAVQGLELSNIRIADSKMNLYPLDGEYESGSEALDYQFWLREQMRDSLETQVMNFLTPVFGFDSLRVAVNVALNFDQESVASVEFAPPIEGEEGGIIVSMQELYESTREVAAGLGVPGTDTNGVGLVEYPYGGLDADQVYSKVLREMNYEINETQTQIERAQGSIKQLSIAVLIDSEKITDDYTQNVRNLVAQAIGVNPNNISVERLPFQFTQSEVSSLLDQQNAFMRAIWIKDVAKVALIILGILALALIIFSFLRTLVGAITGGATPVMAGMGGMGGGTVMGIDYLAGEDLVEGDGELEEREQRVYAEIDVLTKPESVEQLEKFIERDAQAVAQLLRNWLAD